MATIKRLTKNKKMNIGKGDNVNDDDNSLIFINNKVNPVTAKKKLTIICKQYSVLVENNVTDIEFTRLDTRDSWMEAMATLTDSEDEDTVGIATLPSFKRRTGEDAVSLHDHDVAVAHDHDGAVAHDHDGAGAHDHDLLR